MHVSKHCSVSGDAEIFVVLVGMQIWKLRGTPVFHWDLFCTINPCVIILYIEEKSI